MAHTAFAVVVLVSCICGIIAHLMYILKFSSIDLQRCVFAFMGVIAFVSALYIVVAEYLLRFQIRGIFEQLSNIYTTRTVFAPN